MHVVSPGGRLGGFFAPECAVVLANLQPHQLLVPDLAVGASAGTASGFGAVVLGFGLGFGFGLVVADDAVPSAFFAALAFAADAAAAAVVWWVIGLLGAPGGAASGAPGAEWPSAEPDGAVGAVGSATDGAEGVVLDEGAGTVGLLTEGAGAKGTGAASFGLEGAVALGADDDGAARPEGAASGSLVIDWACTAEAAIVMLAITESRASRITKA